MKRLLWLGLLLSVAAASAQTTTKTKTKTSGSGEVQELRDALEAQQNQIREQRQQMEALQAQLQQLIEASQKNSGSEQKVQTSAEQAQATASEAQKSAEEAQRLADQASANAIEAKAALSLLNTQAQDETKRMAALEGVVGRFRFNGDIRIRGDSYFQDYTGFQNRNRARVRVRFGFDGKLNEDFIGGLSLATGSLGDPSTTNETLANFFDRKTIGLDRAYVTYNPIAHNWLSLTGGKFAYQWQRTSVTGDPDINPEGFDEKLSYNLDNKYVKNVTGQLMQFLFNEVAAGTDSYTLGGQVSAKLQIGRWTANPSYLMERWQQTSALLQASGFAVQATKIGNTTTGSINATGEGPGCASGNVGGTALPSTPTCAFSPNGMTNAVVYGPDGKTPTFLSGFFYSDFILNNQIQTGWQRFPVNLLLEYEQNLDAASHPLDTKGNVIANLGSQNRAYGFDVSLGQTKNRNDIQAGYSYLRQEQDAVLASFAESDQRAPTNILQHRFYGLWKIRPNTVAAFTWWHGRALNTNLQNNIATLQKTITTPGQTEAWLNRLQFDLIYQF
jgi:hypothetical protein